jgi:anaerobic selenocysteine-containing dehydrogenase
MAKRGLSEGDRVDLVTASTDGIERAVRNIRVVRYQVPDGCCAAYYPETNPLMPLYARDPLSHTPSGTGLARDEGSSGATAEMLRRQLPQKLQSGSSRKPCA